MLLLSEQIVIGYADVVTAGGVLACLLIGSNPATLHQTRPGPVYESPTICPTVRLGSKPSAMMAAGGYVTCPKPLYWPQLSSVALGQPAMVGYRSIC